jgi:hypothetical protein
VGRVTPHAPSLGPLTSWTGWDVRGSASDWLPAAETFARWAPQALDAGAHYELLAVAARGFRPPQFLSTVNLAGEDESELVEQEDGDRGLKQTWSLLYRRVAEIGSSSVAPYAIYLLGVNPPPGTTGDELDVFNDFYTNVHLPEVAERRHALRAERYELVREVRPPHRGAPQFLAVYEVDEQAASNRRHSGPSYASGPQVWQRHTTPWRLWYRRLASGASETAGTE